MDLTPSSSSRPGWCVTSASVQLWVHQLDEDDSADAGGGDDDDQDDDDGDDDDNDGNDEPRDADEGDARAASVGGGGERAEGEICEAAAWDAANSNVEYQARRHARNPSPHVRLLRLRFLLHPARPAVYVHLSLYLSPSLSLFPSSSARAQRLQV